MKFSSRLEVETRRAAWGGLKVHTEREQKEGARGEIWGARRSEIWGARRLGARRSGTVSPKKLPSPPGSVGRGGKSFFFSTWQKSGGKIEVGNLVGKSVGKFHVRCVYIIGTYRSYSARGPRACDYSHPALFIK